MLFKAFVRLATRPARIYQEDPTHPEEFSREALLQREISAVREFFARAFPRSCIAEPSGRNPDGWQWRRCGFDQLGRMDEPFPEPGWDCVSYPLLGHTQHGIPLGCDEFCRRGKRWLGIEIEYPEVPAKYATAWAPNGDEVFGEYYSEKPPSFYEEVREYFPVWKIKAAAAGED